MESLSLRIKRQMKLKWRLMPCENNGSKVKILSEILYLPYKDHCKVFIELVWTHFLWWLCCDLGRETRIREVSSMTAFYDEVEIEDMTFNEAKQTYYYPCPCGDKFYITVVSICDKSWLPFANYFRISLIYAGWFTLWWRSCQVSIVLS